MSDFGLSAPPSTRRERRRLRERQSEVLDSSPQSTDTRRPVILAVCTGNICRSPMAEALLRARLETVEVTVHSAGTRALVGKEMPDLSQDLAVQHGAAPDDVTAHRARWLVEQLADDADLVLAMSREHRTAAVELSPRHLRHTFTVREFARLAAGLSDGDIRRAADAADPAPRARLAAAVSLVAGQRGLVAPPSGDGDDVIDPYRRGREVYEESAAQLVPAVDEVARVVRAALA